jgi:hypothetical protein
MARAKTIAKEAMSLRDFDRHIGLISESTGLLNLLSSEGGGNLQPAQFKVKHLAVLMPRGINVRQTSVCRPSFDKRSVSCSRGAAEDM